MADYTVEQLNTRIKQDPEMTQLFKDDPTEFESRANDIYKRFGYNPDGTPLSSAMKGIGKVSRATGIPEGIVQGVANIPIPLATTIAGAAAGSFAPGPGTLIGASVGSMAGEEINYQLGLRDKPSASDLTIAAGAPAIGPLASRLKGPLSSVIQSLPGAGKTMHNLAHETLKKNLKYMEVSREEVQMMRGLFKNIPDFRTDVPMLRATIKQELDEVTKSLKPDTAYIKQLNELTRNLSSQKNISFKNLMSTEADFNKMKDAAPGDVWGKLAGTLITDLEQQAQNPLLSASTRGKILQGVESFKNYIAVNNRFKGQETLTKFLESSTTRVDDGLIRFNKKAFLKQIESDNKLTQTFEATELADIKKSIADLGYIGAAPQGFTSGAVHTGSLGVAGLAGYAVAGVSGVIATTAVLASLRLALGSEMGRRAITHLAKKGHGTIQSVELKEMMGKITAGMSAGAVAGVSGGGTNPASIQPFPNQE